MTPPLFSIVIPTFNRPGPLRACLGALAALEAGVPFEVIVVDDGSPQSPEPVVAAFQTSLAIRLLTRRPGGPGAARNTGAAAARGRFLAFIDDDCQATPGWLAALAKVLTSDDRRLVGGPVENALRADLCAEASQHVARFVYEYNRRGGASEPFFTTNNLAVSTARFLALGGFTTRIPSATAEDKEFCDRWRAQGFVLAHAPDAVVYHAHALTFPAFVRQHFNYGRGILAFRVLRRRRGGARLRPEPLRFYTGLLRSAWSDRTHPPGALFGLLMTSQVATVAGALWEAAHWRRLRHLGAADGSVA